MSDRAFEFPTAAKKALFEYAPAFVGAGIWAFARFPRRMGWAGDVYGRAFAYLAAFYSDLTRVEGYGDALVEGLGELRSAPHRILDLGTGTGFVARKMKSLWPDAEVVGTDIQPAMVAIAQKEAAAEGLQIDFQVADSQSLPFVDSEFDLVVLQNSLVFPEEVMRVTAPSGKALIVVSFAGPWVALAWPALAARLEESGASTLSGRRAGTGFFGIATKSGRLN